MKSVFRGVAVCISVSALAVGCAAEPSPNSPSAGLTQPIDPPKAADLGRAPSTVQTETLYSIWLMDSVRVVCAGPDPYFQFDSSKPMGPDQPTMKNLLACMTVGPLQGKNIKLTGHADPRGTATYNEKLGLERADQVKKYLVDNGISSSRVQTSSVGKEFASSDPQDWPSERRVAVEVVR